MMFDLSKRRISIMAVNIGPILILTHCLVIQIIVQSKRKKCFIKVFFSISFITFFLVYGRWDNLWGLGQEIPLDAIVMNVERISGIQDLINRLEHSYYTFFMEYK